MARPSKTRLQMLQELGPLSSGGIISGTQGQSFTGAPTSTDYVNADKLVAANQGKGTAMQNAALGGQVDETADWAPFNDVVNRDQADIDKHLQSNTVMNGSQTTSDEHRGNGADQDNWYKTTTDTWTPTTTTTYDGMSSAKLAEQAAKVRGLKSQFEDFGKAFGDNTEGADTRASLLNDKNKKNIATYSAGQNALDSFLAETEGQPVVQSKSEKIKSLMGKFDGFDQTATDRAKSIQAAEGKVGTVVGPSDVKTSDIWTKNTKPIPEIITPPAPTLPPTSNGGSGGPLQIDPAAIDGTAYGEDPNQTPWKDGDPATVPSNGQVAVDVGPIDAGSDSKTKTLPEKVVDELITKPTEVARDAVTNSGPIDTKPIEQGIQDTIQATPKAVSSSGNPLILPSPSLAQVGDTVTKAAEDTGKALSKAGEDTKDAINSLFGKKKNKPAPEPAAPPPPKTPEQLRADSLGSVVNVIAPGWAPNGKLSDNEMLELFTNQYDKFVKVIMSENAPNIAGNYSFWSSLPTRDDKLPKKTQPSIRNNGV